jgi:hypothetical protein
VSHVCITVNGHYFPIQHLPTGVGKLYRMFSVRYELDSYVHCTVDLVLKSFQKDERATSGNFVTSDIGLSH